MLIKDKTLAEVMLKKQLKASRQLQQDLIDIRNQISEQEYIEYRRATGYIVAEIFEKIIKPICQDHPELTPTELKVALTDN
ncbi:hypothetical protein GKQ23_12540 [Erwinia sp. E602]|uniref:hypothetical protein n=1 Tax=Erwinia sp. E602 TaxID=2675378 RepID=UPI001BA6D7AF|nr:hypothetical protein [Erwinia sp. E602]QUG75771.1 hypothetical protein GKQ23_12540 [Erwinia sp. E602]